MRWRGRESAFRLDHSCRVGQARVPGWWGVANQSVANSAASTKKTRQRAPPRQEFDLLDPPYNDNYRTSQRADFAEVAVVDAFGQSPQFKVLAHPLPQRGLVRIKVAGRVVVVRVRASRRRTPC